MTDRERRLASKGIPISKKLLKLIGKTNAEFKLIGEGDKVLVGLSGGKDSLALVHALKHVQRHAPFKFEFEACTIKYGMPDEHYDFLVKHCEEYGIKHTVYDTNIFEISHDTIRENSSFCSYFSRMRRGALYTFAEEGGFNKVALGHHFDDTVESFFMNMFYNGSMRALAPIYKTLKLPQGRLELMSGIKERRFWDKGTRPSDAAVLAGKKAIAASGIPASELECLIFTSVSRDMMEPATASFVHNQLGLPSRSHLKALYLQGFLLSGVCVASTG